MSTSERLNYSEEIASKRALFTFLRKSIEEKAPDGISKESQGRIDGAAQGLREWSKDPKELSTHFRQTLFSELGRLWAELHSAHKLFDDKSMQIIRAVLTDRPDKQDNGVLSSVGNKAQTAHSILGSVQELVGEMFDSALNPTQPSECLNQLTAAEKVKVYVIFEKEMQMESKSADHPLNDNLLRSYLHTELSKASRVSIARLFVEIEGEPAEKLVRSLPEGDKGELLASTWISCDGLLLTLSKEERSEAVMDLIHLHMYGDTNEEATRHITDLVSIKRINFLVSALLEIADSWIDKKKQAKEDDSVTEMVRDLVNSSILREINHVVMRDMHTAGIIFDESA